jgi:hypothetical protein
MRPFTFDLYLYLHPGGGRHGVQGAWVPQLAMNRFLPLLATQIPTLWIHTSGGGAEGGGALILDRCRVSMPTSGFDRANLYRELDCSGSGGSPGEYMASRSKLECPASSLASCHTHQAYKSTQFSVIGRCSVPICTFMSVHDLYISNIGLPILLQEKLTRYKTAWNHHGKLVLIELVYTGN